MIEENCEVILFLRNSRVEPNSTQETRFSFLQKIQQEEITARISSLEMLRQVQRIVKPVRCLVAVQPHEILKLGKTATLKGKIEIYFRNKLSLEITFAYMALAKVHHPDYGGDPEDFRIVNQAYRAMKKKFAQGTVH